MLRVFALLGLLVVATATATTQSGLPFVGLDNANNLHINSTAPGRVFIDGVDVLDELARLRGLVTRLESLNIPSSSPPTTAVPTRSVMTTAATTTLAPTTSPTISPSLTPLVCGSVRVYSDTELLQQLPTLRRCGSFTGTVDVRNVADVAVLSQAFRAVSHIGGDLYVYETSALTTLGTAFGRMLTIDGHIVIRDNAVLTTLGTGFSSMHTGGGFIEIFQNGQLAATRTPLFGALESLTHTAHVGDQRHDLLFRDNGAQFCASAGALCAATELYSGAGASNCCGAFCGANRVNC